MKMNTRLIAAPFVALCLTISLVFSAGAALAQETEKPALPEDYLTRDWDLNACVMRGLEANPAILAARHELTGSEYDVYAALAAMLPTATASYGYTYQDRGHDDRAKVGLYDDDLWAASLNVNQPLFPGLSLLSTFQKRQLTNERAETKLTQAELNLVESIQTNFFSLLQARMDVKSAEDAVQRLQSQLQVTTAFYDVGLQPRLDVLQAEVDLASAEQSLLIAKNNLAIQHAQLNTLLDFPLEAEVRYVGELTQRPFSLEFKDCLERAYLKRPDIIIGQKSVDIAGKDLNIAAADMLPSFDADWDYVKRGNSADLDAGSDEWDRSSQEYWTAGVSASYSIGAGKDISETLSAREAYRQVRAQLETTRLRPTSTSAPPRIASKWPTSRWTPPARPTAWPRRAIRPRSAPTPTCSTPRPTSPAARPSSTPPWPTTSPPCPGSTWPWASATPAWRSSSVRPGAQPRGERTACLPGLQGRAPGRASVSISGHALRFLRQDARVSRGGRPDGRPLRGGDGLDSPRQAVT
jgi:outer membrane protein TolC